MKLKLAAVAVVLGLAGAAWVVRDLYRPYQGFTGSLIAEIEPGSDASSIADLLVERGVLAHRFPFLTRYWLGRRHHHIKAGEYLFDRPLRPLDVYRRLIQGDVYLYEVVIPEGSDRFDMARIFQERLSLNPADFLRTTQHTALIHDLDPSAPSLEGYLFPDTYRFPRRASAATVVSAMVARFRHILRTKFRGELVPGSPRLHDVMTLASLVEKETPDPAERPVVAGVFARRLEKGMALQSDPTVIYALRLEHHAAGPLTAADLNLDSPFNTYRRAGLPPGPIASPGEVSLRAALQPAEGNALYFVSNNHGGHIFASTLSEHQRNVARYRRQVAMLHHAALPKPAPPDKPATHRHRGHAPRAPSSRKSVAQSN
jgi:UPF0755 protein